MLSIPSTLSLHRSTRALYMDAARRARSDINTWWRSIPIDIARFRDTKTFVLLGRRIDPEKALRCFLRRARQANWRLVAVKRFAREFETGKKNLLNSDDDSVWGDL